MATKLEVILTPALLPHYDLKGHNVVIIDILRATTSICVAFEHGVKRILPVSTPEEAMLFRDFDFVIAAERNAVKVDGFDLGNSPFEYENVLLKDKSIAFTTTNGTKALKLAKEAGASKILIGSFLNLNALCALLKNDQNTPVTLVCAGWKNRFNLEDTLFAGAVAEELMQHYDTSSDATQAAFTLYQQAKDNLTALVRNTAHANRFKLLHGNTDDVSYCTRLNTTTVVPEMKGEYLISGQHLAARIN